MKKGIYIVEKKIDDAINSSSQTIKYETRRFLGTLSDFIIDVAAFVLTGVEKFIFGIVKLAQKHYNRNYRGKHLAD